MFRLVALLVLLCASAQAQSVSLTSYVNAQLPTNTSRAITAANVRNAVLAYPNNVYVNSAFPVTTTSYVTATTYYGDGSHLTGVAGGSSTTPGGTSGSIQFNNGTTTSLGGGNGLTTDGSNVSATGYISGSTFYGDGSHLTGIAGGGSSSPSWYAVQNIPTVVQNISNSTGSVTVTSINAATATLTSIGAGSLTASGVVSANALDAFFVSGTSITGGTGTFTNGLTVTNAVVVSGTVSATQFVGGGAGITGVTAAAMSWYGLTAVPTQVAAVSNGTYTPSWYSLLAVPTVLQNISNSTGSVTVTSVNATTGTFTNVAGTATTAAQPSVTSLGTLTGLNVNGQITGTAVGAMLISATAAAGVVTATNVYANHVSATLLYGDGSNITNLPSGGTPASIVSNTTRVDARNDGTISLTNVGVVTGYFDASGRLVVPGISVTTAQTSVTSLSASGSVTVTSVSGSTTGLNIIGLVNNFYQLGIQNTSSGTQASTDYVATADNGTATTHYVDLGINGSTGATAPFTTANAAYLYSTDPELDIGALGSGGLITFNVSGGIATPIEKARITANGLSTTNIVALGNISATGGISATNFQGNGALITGLVVPNTFISTTQNAAGNISGSIGLGFNAAVGTGVSNTSVGAFSGNRLTTAHDATLIGANAGAAITTGGNYSVAIGSNALSSVATAQFNTALGASALQSATSFENTAVGYQAAISVTTGTDNSAFGAYALYGLGVGSNNLAVGEAAGLNLVSGTGNIAIGQGTNFFAATGSNQMNIGKSIWGNVGSGTGNVNLIGINQSSPTASLEVSGTISTTALVVNGVAITTNGGAGGGTSISTTTFTAATNISASTAIGFNAGVGTFTGTSNTLYGVGSGRALTTGTNSTFLGAAAGQSMTTGSSNTIIGSSAARGFTAVNRFTAIGADAVNSTGNGAGAADSVYVGYAAGQFSSGDQNVAIGSQSFGALNGGTNSANTMHVAVGYRALAALSGGASNPGNTAVGSSAGIVVTNGKYNSLFGASSGLALTTGSSNTVIGAFGASNLTTGDNNIVIGANANILSGTQGNQLSIANALYGNIGSGTGNKNLLGVNISSPTANFQVSGTVGFTTIAAAAGLDYLCYDNSTGLVTYSATTCTVSDRKFKTNIVDYTGALDKVLALEVRQFDFKNSKYGVGKQVGLIAQEVEPVLPQLVGHGSNGDMSMDYAKLSVYAIGAIQELNEEVKELRAEIGLPPKHATFGERLRWLATGD